MSALRLVHPHADDAPDLEALYLQPPGVRLGMVASVDGAAVLGGGSAALSGDADRQAFRALRRHADVVLVGAGTAREEVYRPVRVPAEHAPARAARGQAPVPPVACVSRGRGLPEDHPLRAPGAGALLFDGVELPDVLAALAERGLVRVLCEGGPQLNGALLAAGLVDEVCVTTSALLAGGDGSRLLAGAPETAAPLELVHLLLGGDVLLARWRVRRP